MPAYWALGITEDANAGDLGLSSANADGPEHIPESATNLAESGLPDTALKAMPRSDVTGAAMFLATASSAFHGVTAPTPKTGVFPVVADIAAVVLQRPDGPVEISLSPQELGRLRIRLRSDGDAVHVSVHVERPETLDLLRRNGDLLMQELRTAGFAGGNLSFSAWGGSQQDGSPSSFDADPDSQALGEQSDPQALPKLVIAAASGLDLRL